MEKRNIIYSELHNEIPQNKNNQSAIYYAQLEDNLGIVDGVDEITLYTPVIKINSRNLLFLINKNNNIIIGKNVIGNKGRQNIAEHYEINNSSLKYVNTYPLDDSSNLELCKVTPNDKLDYSITSDNVLVLNIKKQ